MKSAYTEGKFLLTIIAAVFLLIGIHFFYPQLSALYDPLDYIGIHTILEFFSVSVAMTIFLYGLKGFGRSHSSEMLLLSLTFLIVGLIDLFHALSFKGMPHFITDSSVAKATWFWVTARLLESTLMLYIIAFPSRKLKRINLGWLLFAEVLIAAGIAYLIIHFENALPLLFIEGAGTSTFKNAIEYFVSFMQFVSIVIVLFQYFLEKSETKLYIVSAFVFLLLSELIFTIYQNVYDLDNFTGHLYKVLGYYFILKSFYFSGSSQEMDWLYELLSRRPGVIFQMEEVKNEGWICIFCEGSLLPALDLSDNEMGGKDPIQLFTVLGKDFRKYCSTGTGTTEPLNIITSYKDKILFISAKRSCSSYGAERISGSIVDISNYASRMEAANLNNVRPTNHLL